MLRLCLWRSRHRHRGLGQALALPRTNALSHQVQLHTSIHPPLPMLSYTILFLLIAIIAGALGFGVIAGTAALVAKVFFILFLILFIASLLRGRRA